MISGDTVPPQTVLRVLRILPPDSTPKFLEKRKLVDRPGLAPGPVSDLRGIDRCTRCTYVHLRRLFAESPAAQTAE